MSSATFNEATPNTIQTSDSKPNLRETTQGAFTTTTTTSSNLGPSSTIGNPGNHLEIPSSNNPNLLSVDIINQRRGNT